MRKSSIIILLAVMLLVGCGKKAVETPQPQATTKTSEQVAAPSPTPTPSPTASANPQEGNQPSSKDLEKLIEKSNNTKDEKEHAKIMAEIQKILEQAEKNAPAQK